MLLCPVCHEPLVDDERGATCAGGHRFDRAREGYLYLLRSSKSGDSMGDPKSQARSRRDFLNRGYYAPLRDAMVELVRKQVSGRATSANGPMTLLDICCGEGYYTSGIRQALAVAGKLPKMAGIDISRSILRLAAKREKYVELAVASCFHLPFADEAADILLDCFSPLAIDEFRRVLKPGGHFLYVVPGAKHLWELKQVLYDRPYPNEEKETPYAGFSYEAIIPVDFTLHLTSPADIRALFQMTPYCWKTPRAGVERMEQLETLNCQASFHIHVFQKL